jgi:hypothetical protein
MKCDMVSCKHVCQYLSIGLSQQIWLYVGAAAPDLGGVALWSTGSLSCAAWVADGRVLRLDLERWYVGVVVLAVVPEILTVLIAPTSCRVCDEVALNAGRQCVGIALAQFSAGSASTPLLLRSVPAPPIAGTASSLRHRWEVIWSRRAF